MNAKAKLIGMVGTGFMNPHGLDAVGHVTTARDILMMGIHAVSFNNIVSVWNKKVHRFNIRGSNAREMTVGTSVAGSALTNYYYIFGGKTGTVPNVMNVLLIVNAPNGDMFVGVVLKALGDRFADAKEVFDVATLYLNPDYIPPEGGNIVNADKVAVCLLPKHNPAFFMQYDVPLLFGKNETVAEAPASITKIMTAMVLLENVYDINEMIEIIASDITIGSGGTFYAGDKISFKDALYCLLLPSSNTMAVAVSRVVGGKILRSKQ